MALWWVVAELTGGEDAAVVLWPGRPDRGAGDQQRRAAGEPAGRSERPAGPDLPAARLRRRAGQALPGRLRPAGLRRPCRDVAEPRRVPAAVPRDRRPGLRVGRGPA